MQNYENKPNIKEISKSILILIAPSIFGLVCYFFIYIVILFFSVPSSYKSGLLSINIHLFSGTSIGNFFNRIYKITGTHTFNQISYYLFWIIIASIIVFVASKISHNVEELTEDFNIKKYIWPKNADEDKNRPLKEFIEKLLFHLLMLSIILIYLFGFMPGLIHYVSHFNVGLSFSINFFYSAFKLLFYLFCYLHFLVILFRIFLIRKRIFF